MDRAGDLAATETRADLESLGGWNGQHSVSKLGLKLIKAGLAETRGTVANDTGDGSSDTVGFVAEVSDEGGHALRGFDIWAAHGKEGVNLFARD